MKEQSCERIENLEKKFQEMQVANERANVLLEGINDKLSRLLQTSDSVIRLDVEVSNLKKESAEVSARLWKMAGTVAVLSAGASTLLHKLLI